MSIFLKLCMLKGIQGLHHVYISEIMYVEENTRTASCLYSLNYVCRREYMDCIMSLFLKLCMLKGIQGLHHVYISEIMYVEGNTRTASCLYSWNYVCWREYKDCIMPIFLKLCMLKGIQGLHHVYISKIMYVEGNTRTAGLYLESLKCLHTNEENFLVRLALMYEELRRWTYLFNYLLYLEV